MRKSEIRDVLIEGTKKFYKRHLRAVPRPNLTHDDFYSLFVPEHFWGPFKITSENARFGHAGILSATIANRRVGLLLQTTDDNQVIPLAAKGPLEIRNHGTPLHEAFVKHVEELTDVSIGWARVRALIERLLCDGYYHAEKAKTYTVREAVYLLPGLKALANDDVIEAMADLKANRPQAEFALRKHLGMAAQTITLAQILPENEDLPRESLPFEVRIIAHSVKEDGLEMVVNPPE